MKIKSVTKIKSNLDVFDIGVEEEHHYILDNGIVSHNSYVPTKESSGGGGIKYSASGIIELSKKKEKEGTEIVGNIIKVKMAKSRLTKEYKTIETRLFFDKGLDRYYGLAEFAEQQGILKREGISYIFPDGSKVRMKQVRENASKYFNDEVLKLIDEKAKLFFMFGSGEDNDSGITEYVEEDTTE